MKEAQRRSPAADMWQRLFVRLMQIVDDNGVLESQEDVRRALSILIDTGLDLFIVGITVWGGDVLVPRLVAPLSRFLAQVAADLLDETVWAWLEDHHRLQFKVEIDPAAGMTIIRPGAGDWHTCPLPMPPQLTLAFSKPPSGSQGRDARAAVQRIQGHDPFLQDWDRLTGMARCVLCGRSVFVNDPLPLSDRQRAQLGTLAGPTVVLSTLHDPECPLHGIVSQQASPARDRTSWMASDIAPTVAADVAADNVLERIVQQQDDLIQRTVQELGGERTGPVGPTWPEIGRQANNMAHDSPLQIDMGRHPMLASIDRWVTRTFALRQWLPLQGMALPTVYCESAYEFFSTFVELMDVSQVEREAYVQELVQRAEQDSPGGMLGVHWPGRGCYINGWLFGQRAGCTPAKALADPQTQADILATVAHEKWGHGFLGECSTSGQERVQLQMWRYRIADQFDLRLTDTPRATLLRDKWRLLFGTAQYLEEGWSTWIEHQVLTGLPVLEQHGRPGTALYTAQDLLDRLQSVMTTSQDKLNALCNAVRYLLSDQADVEELLASMRVVHAYDDLARPALPQPLPYVLGYLLIERLAQRVGKCVPAAVFIAANVRFDAERIAVSDLERVVANDPRMHLDTRLAMLTRLRLNTRDDIVSLARAARTQWSLAVPEEMTGYNNL